VDLAQEFCDNCGERLDGEQSSGAPEGTAAMATLAPATPFEAKPAVLPGSRIRCGHDEVVWKTYHVAMLRRRSLGEGILYVTDSRVVFYAFAKGRGAQRASRLVQQTKLEDITGLSSYVSRRISLFLVILAFWLGLGAIGAILANRLLLAFFLVALTAGCVAVMLLSKRGRVGVVIHSRESDTSPISFGNVDRGLIGSLIDAFSRPFLSLFGIFTAFDVTVGRPGPDSDQVIDELGALLLDLQTRGTEAGSHWGIYPEDARAQSRGAI
jgi:hypothetical protein